MRKLSEILSIQAIFLNCIPYQIWLRIKQDYLNVYMYVSHAFYDPLHMGKLRIVKNIPHFQFVSAIQHHQRLVCQFAVLETTRLISLH